ncbi:MAG: HAD family phosphatase [Lachnospiraceae bacterium]|nr:HAD family phosphatase [Lachnospiraceae bacterium]
MIKLAALDLDGTLLSDDKTICNENREAIREALKQGCKVVLCSGRSPGSLQFLMKELGLNIPGQYGIALNGAVVFEADTGKVISAQEMEPESAEAVLRVGVPLMDGLNIQLYHVDKVFVQRWDETSEFYEKVTHTKPVLVKDLRELTKGVIKMSYFQKWDEAPSVTHGLEEILALKEKVEPQLPKSLAAQVSAPYLLEFMRADIHKGIGMEALGEILGIRRDEMMGVGDLENDLGMLEYAGVGVAMKNGTQRVKDQADYVTERTNNEGGVAEVIRRFVLEA